MSFPFQRVLVVGATSGIGKAFAERLVANGRKVIVVGRRTEILDEFVAKHGSDKAAAMTFDVMQTDKISDFAKEVTTNFPDLDCVVMNSGIQRIHKFYKPESVDLGVFQSELTTNFVSCVAMTTAFLPFLISARAAGRPTAVMYTTSNLAIVPLARSPGYSASKAAMHAFILSLREQLARTGVRVVELLPPAVQTEIHDARHQPELADGGSEFGIPLADFDRLAWDSLCAGNDTNIIASEFAALTEFEFKRQEIVGKVWQATKPDDA